MTLIGWRAAEAFVSWLDDPAIDTTSTLEAGLVVVWQLHRAGEADRTRDVLARIAARVATEERKPGLHYLARMAVLLELTLPTELAREALDQGILTVDSEVETLRRLATNHDTRTTLAAGRLADTGGKLALMHFLAPLAERVGDQEGNRRAAVVPDVLVAFGPPSGPRQSYKHWEEGKARLRARGPVGGQLAQRHREEARSLRGTGRAGVLDLRPARASAPMAARRWKAGVLATPEPGRR
ncbi:MAG: hypothetical protein OXU77_20625 [Gammaproteobacteria bacterium]|nr:hypothetical protein [Gammaproteobacteria bacterium]